MGLVLQSRPNEVVLRHGHMACGIGAGAKGFNLASPRVGNLRARFECAGGIDVDPGAIANFKMMTGIDGTVLDLFNREQYIAFHGKEPPFGWTEVVPEDIRRVFGRLDIMFSSYPCKGFSGLLSNEQSLTDKYQALNALTLRGMWLSLEAYKDDPVAIILFENVPRIRTRGRWLLDQIVALLHAYGYHVAESEHDCGEVGGLAQSRKRFLLVARHPDKVPDFMYEPAKFPLRGVGEVIGKLPLPGDPNAGVMHRVPSLQWRTWVRLAFVEAGKDWRSLNRLEVENGMLRDYGIIREDLRDNAYGVCRWTDAGPLVTGARAPGQGKFSVADPRMERNIALGHSILGINGWSGSIGAISSRGGPTNGAYSVADPRGPIVQDAERRGRQHGKYPVAQWGGPSAAVIAGRDNGASAIADPRTGYGAGTHQNILCVVSFGDSAKSVTGAKHVAGGALAVADIRVAGHPSSVQLGVKGWQATGPVITGNMWPGCGVNSIADPRIEKPRFNNTYRIVAFGDSSPAVAGPGGPGGGMAVADPRPVDRAYVQRKYKVTGYGQSTRTVIGASTTGDGAFAVADPKCTWGPDSHRNKLKVVSYTMKAPTVTGTDRVGSGACSVADPRPVGLNAARASYMTQGHYGVHGWSHTTGAVPGFAKYDRGRWAIADPRGKASEFSPSETVEKIDMLPEPGERLIARIIALDGTWHRPFTTLELAALQSLFDPEEAFALVARSDAMCREWIGNAVPSEAARGMGETIGEALLRARLGITFSLSARSIWVSPLDMALAVNTRQPAWQMDAGLI